jgi:hypothetical protein
LVQQQQQQQQQLLVDNDNKKRQLGTYVVNVWFVATTKLKIDVATLL